MTDEYLNFEDEILLSLGVSIELIAILPHPKADNVYLAIQWLSTKEVTKLTHSAIVYHIKNMNKPKNRKFMNREILRQN